MTFPKSAIGALCATAAVLMFGPAQAALVVGQPAPAFEARDVDGHVQSLAKYRGKTVILEWTSGVCRYVRHAYLSGVMPSLQERAAKDGIVWLSVNSSAPGKPGFLKANEVGPWDHEVGAKPAHTLLDPKGDVGRLYEAKTTPEIYIINPAGKLVYTGGFDDKPSSEVADAKTAHNYVKAALDDLKAGRPVREAVTQSYGCSVKYEGS